MAWRKPIAGEQMAGVSSVCDCGRFVKSRGSGQRVLT